MINFHGSTDDHGVSTPTFPDSKYEDDNGEPLNDFIDMDHDCHADTGDDGCTHWSHREE